MVLNTRRLFLSLLRTLEIDTACDVGSMNGAEALAFRRACPKAHVLAYEPNPHNLALMQGNPALAVAAIELVPVAITDFDGSAHFYLVRANYLAPHDRRGMSSLYQRDDQALRDSTVEVRTARLDSSLQRDSRAPRRIALWVDVEGKAFEALRGASGLMDEIQLVHVEVEMTPCIGNTQRLYPEVKLLMETSGFELLATDRPDDAEQFNALFVRRGLPAPLANRIAAQARWNRCRSLLINALRRACPGCARALRRLLGRA